MTSFIALSAEFPIIRIKWWVSRFGKIYLSPKFDALWTKGRNFRTICRHMLAICVWAFVHACYGL